MHLSNIVTLIYDLISLFMPDFFYKYSLSFAHQSSQLTRDLYAISLDKYEGNKSKVCFESVKK